MNSVNLDSLHTLPYRSDGRARDPHDHHRRDLLMARRLARRAQIGAVARRIVVLLGRATGMRALSPTRREKLESGLLSGSVGRRA